MNEWQPIETAPAGTILIFDSWDRQIYIGERGIFGGWQTFPQTEPNEICKPSHWMPLPDAPKNP